MGSTFRKHILICTKDGAGRCAEKGGMEVFQRFRTEIRERGLEDLLSTQVGCTGQHSVGPAVIIHPDGVWYKQVTPEDVPEIIEKHLLGGEVVARLLNEERSVSG